MLPDALLSFDEEPDVTVILPPLPSLESPAAMVKSPPLPLELLPTEMPILPAAPLLELEPVARNMAPLEPASVLVAPVDRMMIPESVE